MSVLTCLTLTEYATELPLVVAVTVFLQTTRFLTFTSSSDVLFLHSQTKDICSLESLRILLNLRPLLKGLRIPRQRFDYCLLMFCLVLFTIRTTMTFTQLVAEYFEMETLTIQFNTLRSLTVAPLELLFLGLLQRNLLFLHAIILATVSMILRVTALTKGLTGVFSMRGVLNGEALLLTLFEISHGLIVL